MKLQIKQEDAQKLLDYIQTKPFSEVFQLVNILTTLQPVPEAPAQPAVTPVVEEKKEKK